MTWSSTSAAVIFCESSASGHGRFRAASFSIAAQRTTVAEPQSYIGLADIFGVFFAPTSTVYLVPIDAVAAFEGRLRLEPTRNNQKRLIRFAADFEIDRWTPEALLGELKPAAVEPEPELNFA